MPLKKLLQIIILVHKYHFMIGEIRKLTGLSHQKLGSWLGVSRTMVQSAEMARRSLKGDAANKLTMLALTIQQLKEAQEAKPAGPATCSNPAAFAKLHKKKMDTELFVAEGLRLRLVPLLQRHQQLTTGQALLHAMRNIDSELYRSTKADEHITGKLEALNESNIKKLVEKIERLQDKLEVHLAYAELHRGRWERFEGAVP
jgi:hypothetical protein